MNSNKMDKIALMKSLNISVHDGNGSGDNLILERYGIKIPYNINNFMLFKDDSLVSDILRRFREKQMDFRTADYVPPTDGIKRRFDNFLQNKIESDKNQIALYEKENKPKYTTDNFKSKKKNIKKNLIEKGLMCSDIK